MSDEKSEGNTFNINAVPSCVDEPVKALLKPSANELGGFFGDLLSLVTSRVHFSAEKQRIRQEHDLQMFKDELVEAGFTPLPTWQDALSRYLKEIEQ